MSSNPQGASPANTYTQSDLDNLSHDLKRALPNVQFGPRDTKVNHVRSNTIDICDMRWEVLGKKATTELTSQSEQESDDNEKAAATVNYNACNRENCQGGEDDCMKIASNDVADPLDWYGAPRFSGPVNIPRAFRQDVRAGKFTGPTNGVCPGFLQCNMVVLPEGRHAFDFLLFCQRNPQSCPLIEVLDVGSVTPTAVAPGADLRSDVPKYAIYRNGKLDKEVTDVFDCWPERSVAFLIGCSFSYDGALTNAGIPLRSVEQNKNVPMYLTNIKCRPAGSLHGNMVVSMKPIPAMQVSKHVEITSKYTHAHGGPVCVGSASAIGIRDINKPEWGDRIDVANDEVPVFHACGVTPQSVLMESKVPFAITHSAGHMFVTDLPSSMGV